MQVYLHDIISSNLLKKLLIVTIAVSSVSCSTFQNIKSSFSSKVKISSKAKKSSKSKKSSKANSGSMSFNKAFRHVIKSEGGYSNKENDATGEVRYGITGTTARRNGYKGSMRKLPMSTAKSIYRKKYWNNLPKNLSGNAKFVAFDAAVNQGPGYARKLVRETGGNVKKMIKHRRSRYHSSAKSNPELKKFLKGWMNRLNKVEKISRGKG